MVCLVDVNHLVLCQKFNCFDSCTALDGKGLEEGKWAPSVAMNPFNLTEETCLRLILASVLNRRAILVIAFALGISSSI